MPIIPEEPILTDQGINTTELCEQSKRYLSGLLVGKAIIHPNLLSWDIFTTKEFNIHPLAQTISKQEVIDKLIEIEILYTQESLKPYDPEVKKQQAELRSKKNAGISVAIIVGLTVAFALFGSFATLTCVAYAVFVLVFCLYAGLNFFGEKLIKPEWMKEFSIEKEMREKKITAMKEAKTAIIDGEITEQNSHATMPLPQTSINQAAQPSTTTATTKADVTSLNRVSIFRPRENSDIIQLTSLNTPANKP